MLFSVLPTAGLCFIAIEDPGLRGCRARRAVCVHSVLWSFLDAVVQVAIDSVSFVSIHDGASLVDHGMRLCYASGTVEAILDVRV